MADPRVLVLRAPGTNCDEETAFAFKLAGAAVERIHIQQLLDTPTILDRFQILCIPGGFSYGDDIAAGRILADQLRSGLSEVVQQFHSRDTLTLGICNGFQVLLQTGLLVPQRPERSVSLGWNDSGRFEARWVYLQVASTTNVFLRDTQHIYLPIAHAEGKLIVKDAEQLRALEAQGQIALRYCLEPNGSVTPGAAVVPLSYPANPNGSMGNIAGLSDTTGRVLGLMPHPERYVDSLQHPRWTRFDSPPPPAGRRIFENAVSYFR